MSDIQSSEWQVVQKGRRRQRQSAKVMHEGVIRYETTAQTSRRSIPFAELEAQHRVARVQVAVGLIKARLRESEWWAQLSARLDQVINKSVVAAVQCLGIGSFVHPNALHQLACAVLLKEYLSSTGVFSLTDPAMTDVDLEAANELGLPVVPYEDFNVARPAKGCSSILFMPHCGLQLYDQVFAECASFHFKGIILFANAFSNYGGSNDSMLKEHRHLRQICVSKATQEIPCPPAALSTREFAFNDLAITTVRPDAFKELVSHSDKDAC